MTLPEACILIAAVLLLMIDRDRQQFRIALICENAGWKRCVR